MTAPGRAVLKLLRFCGYLYGELAKTIGVLLLVPFMVIAIVVLSPVVALIKSYEAWSRRENQR